MKQTKIQRIVSTTFADKPKGGELLDRLLNKAIVSGELRVFMPWAAPPNGRSRPSIYEEQTLDWLFGTGGAVSLLCEEVQVQTILMPADSYASRNNFDMASANEYWQAIAKQVGMLGRTAVVPSSVIENTAFMQRLLAEEAYALERLNKGTAPKIIAAASKYTGADTADIAYARAGDYCMYRAAEARYVSEGLEALWISLNAQERDAMCENTPRVYVPEEVRAPWLR